MKNRYSTVSWSFSASLSHRKECDTIILIWTVNALSVRNPRNSNLKNAKRQTDRKVYEIVHHRCRHVEPEPGEVDQAAGGW